MDVRASPDEGPELKEFLGSFHVRIRPAEGGRPWGVHDRAAQRVTPRAPRSINPAVPDTDEQCLQACLTNMLWDTEDLNRQRVHKLIAEAILGDGGLVLDDTGFPKQGTASPGLARQCSDTLGEVGYGPLAVTCCYTDPQASWPVAVRLYLPQAWETTLAAEARHVSHLK